MLRSARKLQPAFLVSSLALVHSCLRPSENVRPVVSFVQSPAEGLVHIQCKMEKELSRQETMGVLKNRFRPEVLASLIGSMSGRLRQKLEQQGFCLDFLAF